MSGTALLFARGGLQRARARSVRPVLPIFDRIGTRVPPPSVLHARTTSQRRRKAAFFDAALRALERGRVPKAAVAVVEDLQWADSATLELLKHLMQHLTVRASCSWRRCASTTPSIPAGGLSPFHRAPAGRTAYGCADCIATRSARSSRVTRPALRWRRQPSRASKCSRRAIRSSPRSWRASPPRRAA